MSSFDHYVAELSLTKKKEKGKQSRSPNVIFHVDSASFLLRANENYYFATWTGSYKVDQV